MVPPRQWTKAAITAKETADVVVTEAHRPSMPSVKLTALTVAYMTMKVKMQKTKVLP